MSLGFYIAGVAGQMAQRKLDDISHNMANVNTTGYVASHASFATFLARLNGNARHIPPAYATLGGRFVDLRKGIIHTTGNDLDFAIRGHAFFRVALTDGGEAYTRAGDFRLDGNGALLTRSGHPVLDTAGRPINLPKGHVSASVEGELSVDGTPVATLGIVRILDGTKVTRIGDALLKTPATNTVSAGKEASVLQGALESSNVNAILTMAEMIDTMRNYQATMKMVEQFDRQSTMLNDRVGRIQG